MTSLSHAQNRRRALAGLTAGAAALALVAVAAAPANAVSSSDSIDANVTVQTAISLTGLAPSFTLTGLPRATVAEDGAVTFNVETNNLAGYAVTVTAGGDALLPADTATNTDEIPIGALSVRESAVGPATPGAFTPLSDQTATTVHTQATRSEEGGDEISNDYQVVIPFVNQDTYTVTLDYVATTL